MTFPLLLVMVATWLVALRRHGPVSFVVAGVLGLSIYSIPAVLQVELPFNFEGSAERYLETSDFLSGVVIFVAWCTVLAVLYCAKGRSRTPGAYAVSKRLHHFCTVLLFFGIIGFLYLAYLQGPLFFLEAREQQTFDFVSLLWKWTPLLGGVSAILTGRRRAVVTFFLLALTVFTRGDRTVIVITCMAAAVVWLWNTKSLGEVMRPKWILAASALTAIVIAGKPLYLALKSSDPQVFLNVFSPEAYEQLWFNFEPVGTFAHLHYVIETHFHIPLGSFLLSIFGHLLIIPSVFGVETNLYNKMFTESLPFSVTYGLAGNYWAHAWSVGGFVAVVGFAWFYAYTLVMCDRGFARFRGIPKVLAATIGATFAVYAHRNGLDNLLSFVRQLMLVTVIAWPGTLLLQGLRDRRRNGAFRRQRRNRLGGLQS